jgi:AcrR family transcriptional regulator
MVKKTAAAEFRRRKPRPSRLNGEATRNRILDTAAKLFAQHGYTAVSLRSITAAAGVNVAAIHFHFASKEALFEAIFKRRIEPINHRRIARLRATIGTPPAPQPEISEVIKAFVEPYMEAAGGFDSGQIVLLQFMARAAAEQDDSIQSVLRKEFDPTWKALVKAAQKALPDASFEAINWGLFFLLGALYFINPSRAWFPSLTRGKCHAGDTAAALHYLLPFLVGGLRAVSEAGTYQGRAMRAAE